MAAAIVAAPVGPPNDAEVDGWWDDVNGQTFHSNATGEVYVKTSHYECIVPPAYPCAAVGLGPFAGAIAAPTGLAVHIVTTRLQTITFMAVQFAYIRGVCRVEEAKISNDALVELCYIRALAIKTQLVSPHYRVGDHNVRYTEAVAYLETGPDVPQVLSPIPQLDGRNHQQTLCTWTITTTRHVQ